MELHLEYSSYSTGIFYSIGRSKKEGVRKESKKQKGRVNSTSNYDNF